MERQERGRKRKEEEKGGHRFGKRKCVFGKTGNGCVGMLNKNERKLDHAIG